MLAIIGGSGLDRMEGLERARRKAVRTPYGKPSDMLTFGRFEGREVMFLARHGPRHAIAPHRINYRANLWALRAQGVSDVVSVAAVGGIRADLVPGALVVPDQILDYTHGRQTTYNRLTGGAVTHIDFTRPYCEPLRQRLLRAAAAAGELAADGGTYAATQGPRLETAAEIDRFERDGAAIVGMTGMPEAALARELDLCYAAIAVVVNHAAGRAASTEAIRVADMGEVMRSAMSRVRRIIRRLVAADGG